MAIIHKASGPSLARRWWLRAWNLRTAPHNAWAVLATAFILIESRVWRIDDGQPAQRQLVLPSTAGDGLAAQEQFAAQGLRGG